PDVGCQPDGGKWNLSSKMAAFTGNAQAWSGYIDYTMGGAFSYVPLKEVLKWAEANDEAALAAAFRGRPVLVGAVFDFDDRHWVLLGSGGVLLAGLVALGGRWGIEALKNAREKNFLKSSFEGYVSPQVLKEILAGRLQPGQRAGRIRACVMFADIRGFTRRSE